MINKIQKLSEELNFNDNKVFFYKFNDYDFISEYPIPITNFPKFKEWIEENLRSKNENFN